MPSSCRAPSLVLYTPPMSQRAPLDYPCSGVHTLNFSLPLRLSHCRSASISSHVRSSSYSQPAARAVEPLSLVRSHSVPRGTGTALPPPPAIRPPVVRSSPSSKIPRFSGLRAAQREETRSRTNSSSTNSSSADSTLEASLTELEELIEALGTPVPICMESEIEGLTVPRARSKPLGKHTMSGQARRSAQSGPRWI